MIVNVRWDVDEAPAPLEKPAPTPPPAAPAPAGPPPKISAEIPPELVE